MADETKFDMADLLGRAAHQLGRPILDAERVEVLAGLAEAALARLERGLAQLDPEGRACPGHLKRLSATIEEFGLAMAALRSADPAAHRELLARERAVFDRLAAAQQEVGDA